MSLENKSHKLLSNFSTSMPSTETSMNFSLSGKSLPIFASGCSPN
ncbi:12673_t:CDS:1, partial [Ambispora leptoticha]